ncbi:MAG: metallophosphoesterase [Polyangiales bacterium]
MLVAVVGDVHGRFFRVEEWVDQLEEARGEPVELVLSVGDVETFSKADDHRRKAAKRSLPAEFAAYASGERAMKRPFIFVGGNNESFEELEPLSEGGALIPNVEFLGLAGAKTLRGVEVAYLSGIYAPTRYERPRLSALRPEHSRQAGYFRATDVAAVKAVKQADLLLLHEWPRGVAGSDSVVAKVGARGIRPGHWSMVGNPYAAALVTRLKPQWVLAGHLHVPHATSLHWDDGTITNVCCLDQAAKPEGGLLWMRWEGRRCTEVGWGTSGEVAWRVGDPWDERQSAPRIRIGSWKE